MQTRSRDARFLEALLNVWEASVQATHDFLSLADRASLRPVVRGYLAEIPLLFHACADDGTVLGFMGIAGNRLEMLFIAPAYLRQGIGGQFVRHAIAYAHVDAVDVNEQNPSARAFYERMGFTVLTRSACDGEGKPFPILHLRLVRPVSKCE